MTDTERIHQSSDKLLEWLQKWPNKSAGKCCYIHVSLDGIYCKLEITPLEVVSTQRIKRIKRWLDRLKKK